MTAVKPKTIQELDAMFDELYPKLEQLTVHNEYVIDDYPIGGSNRGKCKVSIDRHPKRGYRLVRQTTDKNGRWCKPKESTYRENGMCAIVTGPIVPKEVAWLELSFSSIYLKLANYDNVTLVESPFGTSRRREPLKYKVNGVPKEIPADPVSECDLWDAWLCHRLAVGAIVNRKLAQLEVTVPA